MSATVAPPGGIDLGSIYEEHLQLLVGTAVGTFHICETDAQALAHEVFVSFILKAHEIVRPRAWLVSAIYNASRHYLRTRARHVGLSPDYEERNESAADSLRDHLVAREVICCLTARCQLALHLRYVEGYSIQELAEELDTTSRYAQKLVGRCLRQAKQRYAAKENRERDRS